jgi:hypothetical protein
MQSGTLIQQLTLQRGEMGDARHSENEACRGKTSDDRHAARSHSLHNISTKLRANVIGLFGRIDKPAGCRMVWMTVPRSYFIFFSSRNYGFFLQSLLHHAARPHSLHNIWTTY